MHSIVDAYCAAQPSDIVLLPPDAPTATALLAAALLAAALLAGCRRLAAAVHAARGR